LLDQIVDNECSDELVDQIFDNESLDEMMNDVESDFVHISEILKIYVTNQTFHYFMVVQIL
jgi:hypothetical protein